jgi:hypothetical protein
MTFFLFRFVPFLSFFRTSSFLDFINYIFCLFISLSIFVFFSFHLFILSLSFCFLFLFHFCLYLFIYWHCIHCRVPNANCCNLRNCSNWTVDSDRVIISIVYSFFQYF